MMKKSGTRGMQGIAARAGASDPEPPLADDRFLATKLS
jgi:hypothetical protein